MSKPTIYSIAQRCGVSAATVSRVFNRPELVSAPVREQVMAAAHELGYQPSSAARGLVTGRAEMIGLIVPDITNPFFPLLVRAIQRSAERMGSSVMLVDAEESAAAEVRQVAQLRSRVDGVIVASPRSSSAALREAARGLPCVLLNRPLRDLSSVVCDNTSALFDAGDHLHKHGHRSFALLTGPSASWAAARRAQAVRRWARGRGVELAELGPFRATFKGGRQAGAALLGTAATAAFAFDDLTACGVLAELAGRGVSVPGDRSVVGCDDVLLARTVTPNLTTVTAPMEDLGTTAVQVLTRQIEAPGGAPEHVRLPGSFVARDSTGPRPTP
ncbi:LacI family DNA-binding transcriptional regulator [Nonomuraea sp. MG754425]|uniref:LacI family DNA-binding transcriptional regulator n=1 Tax=Nonomuraea sp. MG754425 TaxID=2570319 RepID=UPI001F336FE8|nr:LacI family DNA-binding transcriptional regulator [Nonomuraea sp. MG754425]